MEGRWIYPAPGYRPEKVNAEVSGGNVKKQISEAGQGGKQQAVWRPLAEITLVSIENIKKIYSFEQNHRHKCSWQHYS